MTHALATDVKNTSVRTIKLVAAAARAKGDVVRIGTGDTSHGVNTDISLADNTNVYRVAVAQQDAAINTIYEAAIEGTVTVTAPTGTYTTGHGLDIFDGAVRGSGTAAEANSGVTTNNDFAIVVADTVSGTSVKATLYGSAITAQT